MNSPENNNRREFLQQAASVAIVAPTLGFLSYQLKYNDPNTIDYQETIKSTFGTIENEAGAEKGMNGSISNIKASLRRLALQIELYKKGIAKCSKEDILASLNDDYYCAQQTPGAEEMMATIDKMTTQVKKLN